MNGKMTGLGLHVWKTWVWAQINQNPTEFVCALTFAKIEIK